ncbi:MAG: secretion system protein G [Candidatus Tagabacteria bacterium CG10_big_fil_rev_8_21_14_0_10_40_13]|uniref:Secretion system protein G n=3 Tax=Candidatus Tagaibacteriota TaxID=1817918 RepID=A0A2M8L9M9_9BACT|nr:MAG: secretion system protein G [Candidatus Tagabacteria bacterium CG10_big_fil_rev_8_21_14_0_10_40_13]
MFTKNKKGFTLIELLVVIAIIGILSSVVLASLNSARKKARDARRVADIKQIQLALEMYFDSTGPSNTYPGSIAALAPTYIPVEPKDPLTAVSYSYCGISATDYHLGATLEDANNNALDTDVDFTSTTCGLTGGTAFNGILGTCTAATGDDLCYDVKP